MYKKQDRPSIHIRIKLKVGKKSASSVITKVCNEKKKCNDINQNIFVDIF
jgi:predicted CopG family antitoxin